MRTMVAIPAMSTMMTPFVRSLVGMRVSGEVEYAFTDSSLVYDARNSLAQKAVNENFDRVLWLDTDMQFDRDLFERLSARLDEGLEFCSGLYFTRRPPDIKPVIYEALLIREDESGQRIPKAYPYHNYPKDSLFTVSATGFGCCMMTVNLLKDVGDKYGLPFSPVMGFGEDFSFCMRVTDMGRQLWCDSSIKVGHVGTFVYDERSHGRIL